MDWRAFSSAPSLPLKRPTDAIDCIVMIIFSSSTTPFYSFLFPFV